jgi:hypothetical protein
MECDAFDKSPPTHTCTAIPKVPRIFREPTHLSGREIIEQCGHLFTNFSTNHHHILIAAKLGVAWGYNQSMHKWQ